MKPHFCSLPIPVLSPDLVRTVSRTARRRAAANAPVAVQTAAVAAQDWPAVYEATGTVRARTTAAISSKVMGYVQQVSVQVGDRVREGPGADYPGRARPGCRTCAAPKPAAPKSRAPSPKLENAIAAAKANLDLAQTTFKRMEELAAKKSISNQEFDEASARAQGGPGTYEMARVAARPGRIPEWQAGASRRFAPPQSCATTPRSPRRSPVW